MLAIVPQAGIGIGIGKANNPVKNVVEVISVAELLLLPAVGILWM